jgi:hypothetical protein
VKRPPHGGRPACWLAAGLLACATPAQALQLELANPSLPPEQVAASQALFSAASKRLPQRWADALGRVEIEWRTDLPERVHGRATGRRIQLDRALLPDPAHATAASAPALAALIHELAHLYDRSPPGGLSGQPRLLDLAGWQVSPLWFSLRTSPNAFTDRSPDRYELESPVEFFAVNMEHFLLDPAYGCRRPALYALFSDHFAYAPPRADCAPGVPYLVPGAPKPQPALLQLDPARVHEVDYLFAEGNDRFMSRWGHSMLRLVVCAPGRPPGPDCRLDLQHHVVLSFRAFVDDVQISSWRGLTGSYPSRLFVLPLAQVVEEYTRVELRGLQSIPLRLQPAEIAGLLQRAAKLHWSYDGRYYFLSNNCAVETFKLLHDGVPRLAAADLASITPTGLLRRLAAAGIADSTVLDDVERATRLGYYFAPASAHYQTMFGIADAALQLPTDDVHDWLELSPAQRRPWLPAADMRSAAALLLLENAALRRQQLLARDELKRRLGGSGGFDSPAAPELVAAMRALLDLQGHLGHPASLLPGPGYGLPQQREREVLSRVAELRTLQLQRDSERLHALARDWLSPQRIAALDATRANVDLLVKRLRALNDGGFRL